MDQRYEAAGAHGAVGVDAGDPHEPNVQRSACRVREALRRGRDDLHMEHGPPGRGRRHARSIHRGRPREPGRRLRRTVSGLSRQRGHSAGAHDLDGWDRARCGLLRLPRRGDIDDLDAADWHDPTRPRNEHKREPKRQSGLDDTADRRADRSEDGLHVGGAGLRHRRPHSAPPGFWRGDHDHDSDHDSDINHDIDINHDADINHDIDHDIDHDCAAFWRRARPVDC